MKVLKAHPAMEVALVIYIQAPLHTTLGSTVGCCSHRMKQQVPHLLKGLLYASRGYFALPLHRCTGEDCVHYADVLPFDSNQHFFATLHLCSLQGFRLHSSTSEVVTLFCLYLWMFVAG